METSTQNNASTNPSFCTACGAPVPKTPNAKFCAMCGTSIATGRGNNGGASQVLSAKHWAIIFGLALAIFVPTVFFTDWKTGKVPPPMGGSIGGEAGSTSEEPFNLPIKYKAVQDAALKAPNDLKLQNEYAAVLVGLIREQEEPPQGLILEAVEQLSKILAINPLEPDALLSLADISFNQQIFSKAAGLYERFLALRPNDEEVRTRYGSSLMFQGEFDKSIEQQKMVLKKNPKSFQATAYLAIAIGQKGDVAAARTTAKRALELAPNDEAKKRLQAFIDSLDKKPAGLKPDEAQPRQETGAVAPVDAGATSLEAALRNNPVAGRKFGSLTISGDTATVKMVDFPMQGMPPFAKDKFYSSLADAAKSSGVKTIIFVDSATGNEMDRKSW